MTLAEREKLFEVCRLQSMQMTATLSPVPSALCCLPAASGKTQQRKSEYS